MPSPENIITTPQPTYVPHATTGMPDMIKTENDTFFSQMPTGMIAVFLLILGSSYLKTIIRNPFKAK